MQAARLLTLENAQNYVLNAHIERVTKAQTDICCSKMAAVVLWPVSAAGK